MTISIKHVDLSANRDLIFELDQLDVLILSVHLINYNLSRVLIYNNINLSIILNKYIRLDKILKYETEEYYSI